MPFKFNPATIRALAQLVQVLDKHRFGAIMLVVVMIAAGALMRGVIHTGRCLSMTSARGRCRSVEGGRLGGRFHCRPI